MNRFKAFFDASLKHIDDGLDRYTAVVTFNESFYGLRETEPSMLSEVAYVPRIVTTTSPDGKVNQDVREINKLAKAVLAYISTTKWVRVFGLSYPETMKLTHAEWIMMQAQLEMLDSVAPAATEEET